MFDEEKAKKDIEKMREVYKTALKKLEDIQLRQNKIAKEIYEARKITIEEK